MVGSLLIVITSGDQERIPYMRQEKIDMEATYVLSKDIVAREIEGELIIVPLVSGIGDTEDDLFSLNETGQAIWGHLDGKKSLKEVIKALSAEFDDPESTIEPDVLGLVGELARKKIVEVEGDA
jgi:hypothetical protein